MVKKILIAVPVVLILAGFIFYLSLGAPFDPEKSAFIEMEPPENIDRRIYNSLAGHYTTFLKKSVDTDGEYTLLEIELEPGGGNTPHYHQSFSEEFTSIEGTLGVHVNGENYYLESGESIFADKGDTHYFFNDTDEFITFQVRIEPASPGFEKGLYILYGLINDGKTDEGLPNDILHTALFATYSDTRATGALSVMNPIFSRLAGRAQRQGVEAELVERYYLSHVVEENEEEL